MRSNAAGGVVVGQIRLADTGAVLDARVESHRPGGRADVDAEQIAADHDSGSLAVGEHGSRGADRDREPIDAGVDRHASPVDGHDRRSSGARIAAERVKGRPDRKPGVLLY